MKKVLYNTYTVIIIIYSTRGGVEKLNRAKVSAECYIVLRDPKTECCVLAMCSYNYTDSLN